MTPHGLNSSGDATAVPILATPGKNAREGMKVMGFSETANLDPLRSDILHGVAELTIMPELAEASVRSLPPVTYGFVSLKAILASKGRSTAVDNPLKIERISGKQPIAHVHEFR